ncbi:HAD family hydrolase [Arcanobacterium haemolyticum]|nr:HAD family hydrolase [Arcanobacterium haemolyticum]
MRRIIFLDVDGTLIDHNQNLPDSAREALGRARERGHRLVLCTGRSKFEIYPWLRDLGFEAFVGGNGAYAAVGDKVILDRHLPREAVQEITDWLDNLGADWFWQSSESLNESPGFLAKFTQGGVNGSEAGDWSAFAEQVLPHVREGVPETAQKVTFILPVSCGVDLDGARAHFGDRYTIVDGSVASAEGYTGELSDAGMNKAVGMRAICDYFGVPVSEAIAIGDSANDIEMLAAAGTSVAMGNGTDEAKATASWVTAPINDDGLAKAFERLGLLS